MFQVEDVCFKQASKGIVHDQTGCSHDDAQ